VLGLESLFPQDPSRQDRPSSRPASPPAQRDPFLAALELMRKNGAPGLGIVVPETEGGRADLLERLAFWTAGSSYNASALLLRAVLVVAPRDRLPANASDTVVLFDSTGARVGGVDLAVGSRKSKSRHDLLALHALADEFEAARRARTKPKSPEPGESELVRLLEETSDPQRLQDLVKKVAEHCVPGGYPIWAWRRAKSRTERSWCEWPIQEAFAKRAGDAEPLPFGVAFGDEVRHVGAGCGSSDDDIEAGGGAPMVMCGMGIMKVRSLKLLELTGKR
jgi:hypothetical protein